MTKLIIHEGPLCVLPTLACRVGLNEAIFIQQLHYRCESSGSTSEGRKWYYKSVTSWIKKDFPFWSRSTMNRTIKSCEDKGLILSSVRNRAGYDKTLSYTIDYDHELLSLTQSEQMDLVNVSKPIHKTSSSLQKKSVFLPTILPALAEVWTELMGGAFTYPKAAGLLKPISNMLNVDGPEVASNALRSYIASVDDKKYVSISRFAQTYGSWKKTNIKLNEDNKSEALS